MITNSETQVMYDSILSYNSGIIEFRAFGVGHRAGKRRVVPMKNSATGWFKGVPAISKEIKESGVFHIDPTNPEDTFARTELYHGIQFDLSNPIDKSMLAWILHLPCVELTYNPVQTSVEGFFYIFQKEQEFRRTAERLNLKKEAFRLLTDSPDQELSSYMMLLSLNPFELTPSEQRVTLEDHIDREPNFCNRFINVINDPQRKLKHFAAILLDRQIVKVTTHGQIMFGDILLGKSREEFVHWLKTTENNANAPYFEVYQELVDKTIDNKIISPIGDAVQAADTTSKKRCGR